ncbi:hypothetical protein HN935_02670 [archaeon]|jgi:hypothetical protein|nr:hypothetical protein [archaeon]
MVDLAGIFAAGSGTTPILLFFTAVIVVYAVFVFYFYRFLAKKNLIELNLSKYNQYENPATVKFLATIFYIIEYLVILPVLTFFWFAVLAILILVLSKGLDASTILLISAALVAAVRITSYVSEDLSRDLAKMLPFTLLAIAITTAGFFDISALFLRIKEVPSLFSHVPYYLLFIVAIELIMRIGDFAQSAISSAGATDGEILEAPSPTE